ncbi:LysR family transcriptional regulator [Dyella sp. GSA-30]|uniref:LysR family transcriptional regulator n=1 Tax=Dyella sp. GSA-30 TaxID=2994496 RepID=UPI002493AAAC|nr:LysR family transcriptional regulator [Dyella sp. GSA-30]
MFLTVAEYRGFRAAARHLGVTPSAVSQAIRSLEERVGAPLFSRTTRSVRLTEAGERLLAHARPAVDMLSAGLDAASGLGGEITGRLRINMPRPIVPLLVNRLLPDFLDAHPNIELELVGDDHPIDIVEEGFDAGIRLGNFVQIDMVAKWLTPPERFVVVGAPAFLREHGQPASPYDLQNFRCILLRQSVRALDHWQFVVDGKRITVGVAGPLVINDIESCVRSALRGVGLFQLPHSIVMSHLECGDLQTVLEPYCEEVPGLSLYYPSRSQSLPKLRAFVDFATERMRRPFKSDDYLSNPIRDADR